MLQYRTVHPGTVELLKKLMQVPALADFFLAGGTSLALQIGHRESYDLDFFSRTAFSTTDILLNLEDAFGANLVSRSEHILILFIREIKVDFVYHPYPLKNPIIEEDGIRLLHIEDIAAMKLSAVAGRGRKRDFFDLYFILREFSLPALLNFYAEKYGESSVFHALRSLTYFEDAEADADPALFEDISWNKVKLYVEAAVSKI